MVMESRTESLSPAPRAFTEGHWRAALGVESSTDRALQRMGGRITTMNFKRKGEKALYNFINDLCIGRRCWAPGLFQHHAPLAGGGSMNTSSPPTPCCMNRAYHGCPEGPCGERFEEEDGKTIHIIGVPAYQRELAEERKAGGWRAVRSR